MLRRIFGGVLFFGSFLVGAHLVSAGNNLVDQPTIVQSQTWGAITILGIMALVGLTLVFDKGEIP